MFEKYIRYENNPNIAIDIILKNQKTNRIFCNTWLPKKK